MEKLKKELEKKLHEIATVIEAKYVAKYTGVLDGTSGVSLFYFYYSKLYNSERHYAKGVEFIEKSVELINNEQIFPTFCGGMAGFGWTLEHLNKESFIEMNTNEILDSLDEYLYSLMITHIKTGDYDFLHGALGYGYYFIKRYENSVGLNKQKFKKYLTDLLMIINDLSEKKEDKIGWKTKTAKISDSENEEYNFGLAHGIPSIIAFLSKINNFNEFDPIVQELLKGGVNFLLSYKNTNENNVSIFPSYISESNSYTQSRLAWCYGDLGVGISLWNAAKSLNDQKLKNDVIKIFEHAANRRIKSETLVHDACVCHGVFGIAKIFLKMYNETKNPYFYDTTLFWLNQGLIISKKSNALAGYSLFKPSKLKEEWIDRIDLLEGIAGIGLVIIDFLADFETNWSECLMLE